MNRNKTTKIYIIIIAIIIAILLIGSLLSHLKHTQTHLKQTQTDLKQAQQKISKLHSQLADQMTRALSLKPETIENIQKRFIKDTPHTAIKPHQNLQINLQISPNNDQGQSLGTLFQLSDNNGKAIAAAGFENGASTFFADNNRQLHFFVQQPLSNQNTTVTRVGKPFNNAVSIRLMTLDNQLFAFTLSPFQIKQYQSSTGLWIQPDPTQFPYFNKKNVYELATLTNIQAIAGKPLIFGSSEIQYGSQTIYTSPYGTGMTGLYHDGQLHIFIEGTNKLAAKLINCAWLPGQPKPTDCHTSAVSFTTNDGSIQDARDFPYAMNFFRRQLIALPITSGIASIYNQNLPQQQKKTRFIFNTDYTFQLYSLLHFYNNLIIGAYPSGSLYSYNGQQLRPLYPRVPVNGITSDFEREAQTTAIYDGYLFAGVWPWGEVWYYNQQNNQWSDAPIRPFTAPDESTKTIEPYNNESRKAGYVYDAAGQRITSLISFNGSLYLATSAKDFERQSLPYLKNTNDYGAVFKITFPTEVSHKINWTPTMKFHFVIEKNSMSIYENGKLIEKQKLVQPINWENKTYYLTYGHGIYGNSEVKVTPSH